MYKDIIFKLLFKFKGDNTNYLIFKKRRTEFSQTIDGDECQEWGSNEFHYEGDLWKF